ncbi:permease [Neomoorella humiferrea]|uniref:Putative permease n=1 Tax=Neomoorella humiferrea TaxID=676965 RepID=A0A2T0ART0_9FIRM|nr:permease [Moorella humiferrea]PRR72553.1 putative permease [Moorella humiferrea]
MSKQAKLLLIVAVFLAAYFLPFQHPRMQSAILEAFYMLQEYAREHVLFCLVPALFIAGAMSNFLSSQAVMKYLGPESKKITAYGVGAVSGAILAVCSCTVLPLFMGIYKRGAGLGPAIAFLYSGPAINVLAIILTARVLGWQIGVARALGAVLFSVIIGLIMALLFRGEEKERAKGLLMPEGEKPSRTLGQTVLYFLVLVLILIFAAWGKPAEQAGFWYAVYSVKWYMVITLLLALAVILKAWFKGEELSAWVDSTWDFSIKILPLLFGGVLAAGFLMGRPGVDTGIIPARYVAMVVGGNSLLANFTASVVGAFMYFATLTEVPIVQGLIGSGMGQGPALALLLAGPALSLPSMLVINSVLGFKKTFAYVSLVVIMATLTGMVFGALVG